MGRQKKVETEEENDEAVGTHKVRRELTPDELDERKDRFVTASLEIQDFEEKRTMQNQKVNLKLKSLKSEVRSLGQNIRDGAEWVDAQMTLGEAAAARKAVVRSVQPPAP